MGYVSNLAVGEKGGLPRVWIESRALADEGFTAGRPIDVDMSDSEKIKIKVSDSGSRVVSRRTSKGKITPLIELNNSSLAEWLPSHAARVSISALAGTIEIVVHKDDDAAASRLSTLRGRLRRGAALRVGEVCVGGGILADALHEGLDQVGIKSEVAFAIEKERAYLEQFIKTSRGSTNRTLFINSPMEEVDLSSLPAVDILACGLPCTGASVAGITKNKLRCAEEHDGAGTLFFTWLSVVKHFCKTASIIQLENVPNYRNSFSMVVIRSCLEQWGYDLYEGEVDDRFGGFEKRNRLCLVALTKGLDPFDFGKLTPSSEKPETLGELLEDVAPDDSSWKSYSYIFEKAERDALAGKGFRTQVVTPEKIGGVGVIPRHYSKVQSTNPLLKHPDKDLYRLFTVGEHCSIKAVPQRLVAGLSSTIATQILGQGILWPAFVSVWRHIGEVITQRKGSVSVLSVERASPARICRFSWEPSNEAVQEQKQTDSTSVTKRPIYKIHTGC